MTGTLRAACVIGWPVEHSRSPLIHNYWLDHYGVAGEYRREAVPPEAFAAFIESLDLVITVCTSIAHLSAALGKPTWVLLDVNPHWVWQLERTDSPWYPTATLYRQKNFSQWDPVMDDVARDLATLAANHRHAAPRKRAAKKAIA